MVLRSQYLNCKIISKLDINLNFPKEVAPFCRVSITTNGGQYSDLLSLIQNSSGLGLGTMERYSILLLWALRKRAIFHTCIVFHFEFDISFYSHHSTHVYFGSAEPTKLNTTGFMTPLLHTLEVVYESPNMCSLMKYMPSKIVTPQILHFNWIVQLRRAYGIWVLKFFPNSNWINKIFKY